MPKPPKTKNKRKKMKRGKKSKNFKKGKENVIRGNSPKKQKKTPTQIKAKKTPPKFLQNSKKPQNEKAPKWKQL